MIDPPGLRSTVSGFDEDFKTHEGLKRALSDPTEKAAILHRLDEGGLDEPLKRIVFANVYDADVRTRLAKLERDMRGHDNYDDARSEVRDFLGKANVHVDSPEALGVVRILTRHPYWSSYERGSAANDLLKDAPHASESTVDRFIEASSSIARPDDRAIMLSGVARAGAASMTPAQLGKIEARLGGEQSRVMVIGSIVKAAKDLPIDSPQRRMLLSTAARMTQSLTSDNRAWLEKYSFNVGG